MFSKSITCLLLTLLIITLAVPVLADGNPPPPSGDGSIHPWDNNDGARAGRGPIFVHSGWMWLGPFSNGTLVVLTRRSATQQMKFEKSRSDKATRRVASSEVAIQNR